MTSINQACSIKPRRTKDEMFVLRWSLYDLLERRHPQSIRGLFYAAIAASLIEKAEREYNNVISRLLKQKREAGQVPWDWISDGTRWMRKPHSFSGVEEALRWCAETYRRDLWRSQKVYVEIWCEKEALAGIIYEIASEYDVPLMVVKVFSSVTFLHDAAETIERTGKPAYIYYFGDWDTSGKHIGRDVEAKLKRYAPAAEIHFQRVAINEEQIRQYNLPTRPDKKDSKPAVDLDALPVEILQQLVREAIERHIDRRRLRITRLAEESERDALRLMRPMERS